MSDKPVKLTPAPSGYADWLAELKGQIHAAQQRATLADQREVAVTIYNDNLALVKDQRRLQLRALADGPPRRGA